MRLALANAIPAHESNLQEDAFCQTIHLGKLLKRIANQFIPEEIFYLLGDTHMSCM